MTPGLDAKDRRILFELDGNARLSLAEIGRRVGLSKEVVHYRVSSLEKSGVIFKYFTVIDVSRLGFTNYKGFIKLQKASERQEAEFISWLARNPNVLWLVSCDGQFDVAFGMRAPNIEQYSRQLEEIENKFGQFFLQREIAPIVRGQYFHRNYLVHKEEAGEPEAVFGGVPALANLDELNWKILVELGKNARAPVTEIAQRVDASPDVVGNRLLRLKREGVIQKYILVPDNAKLGQLQIKVLMRLRSVTRQRYAALAEFCRQNPYVFYTVKTFGPWEYELDLEVPNVSTFRTIMRSLKEKFSDIISDYSYITIYKVHKYNFCPAAPKHLIP